MTIQTSNGVSRPGLVTRLALVPAVFAVMALAGGTGAQAHKNHGALNAEPLPKFVAGYVKSKLGGYALTRAYYSHDHAARIRKSFKKAPIQAVADFNGDGKRDWAGLVRAKSGVINLMVIYSKGQTYRHAILQKDVGSISRNLFVSVHLQKPSRLKEFPKSNKKSKTLRLRRPAIEFVYFERSSVVFYWKQRKFASLWTSD